MIVAYLTKESFGVGIPTNPIDTPVVIHTFVILGVIWLAVSGAMESYIYKRKLFSDIANLLASLLVVTAFFLSYAYFTRLFVFPRWLVIFFVLYASTLLILSRASKHIVQNALHRRGVGMRRTVIVGTGTTAKRLALAFQENSAWGYTFCGFLAVDGEKDADLARLGAVHDLERVIRKHRIDEIIVALPGQLHDQALDIAHRCQAEHVRLRLVPDIYEVTMVRATLTEIEDIPLIGLRDPVLTGYQNFVKRCFDIVVASFCIILALPLFLALPVLIWLDSRGPIFFAQVRVGENGKRFKMFKFRSMVADAEERLRDLVDLDRLEQPAFKIKDDPRVTRIGRLLRRTSLDELPQLINVLKGEMSMVGPRPEELQVVQRYELWHRKRLSIKPGITGPMQVNGRGLLPLNERINLELKYISRYSLLEDIKYLLKTIPAICRARGAY